jgi:DNA-directed RNA polymerase alpha subunit
MFSHFEQTQPNTLSFEIQNVDLSIVNSLRRVILSEIPTIALAFDPLTDKNNDITFHKNTSPLHNEYLGHRLSLIPICLSEHEVDTFEKDAYRFHLKVKNTGTETISVTTKDIQVFNPITNTKYDQAFHTRVFPRNPVTKEHILIVKLRPNINAIEQGEEVDIEFFATKGIAQEHARWSPVSCCSMWNKVDEAKAAKALQAKLEGVRDEKAITQVTRSFKSLEEMRYFVVNEFDEPCHFHFKIESECALKPVYIFAKAIEVLASRIDDFVERLRLQQEIVITSLHENKQLFEVTIENETYTLLNVLQSMIYNNEVRYKGTYGLSYIGYYQPHPLDNKMVLKLKFDTPKDNGEVTEFLVQQCLMIKSVIGTIDAEWTKASS